MIVIPKYFCSICASEFESGEQADACEQIGLPEMSYANVGDEITYVHQESETTRTGIVATKYPVRFANKEGHSVHHYAYVVPNNENSWRIVLPVREAMGQLPKEGESVLCSADSFGVYTKPYVEDLTAFYHKHGFVIES